jgi:hypothetical protein
VDIVKAVSGDEIGRLERRYWRKAHHAEAGGEDQSDAKNGDLLLEIGPARAGDSALAPKTRSSSPAEPTWM